VPFTSARILHYSVATALVSLAPLAIGMSGWLYGVGAVVFGVRLVVVAHRLRRDTRLAMPAFRYSIVYLFALFALLLTDHFLRTLLA
jgi:protoheme IX farnesyltransferase